MRTLLTSLFVVIAGMLTLWWTTDSFSAFTLESARRLDMAARPRELPEIRLKDQHGRQFSLRQLEGQYVVATFIYTRCQTVCPVEGALLARLQDALDREANADALLLSVSFDPRDTPSDLMGYARRHGASTPQWRVALVPDDKARRKLLSALGVVVIPDAAGGFMHNAAFYLIDPEGKAVALFDLDSIGDVLAELRGSA